MNTKKKTVLSAIMALVLVLGLLPVTTKVQANPRITVIVNGQTVQFSGQGPVNIDGRILVPVREVFEQLGYTANWDGSAQRLTLTPSWYTRILITVGSTSFTIDYGGIDTINHTLDAPPQIINGAVMLPIRAVIESVGLFYIWDEATSTITISPLHPDHIIIRERTFFTQEQLREMITFAPDELYTHHSTRHPERRMTPEEVQAWSDEYFAMGGMSAQELEIIYLVNAERISQGLDPFWVCPFLAQSARLTSQLWAEAAMRRNEGSDEERWPAHTDPFYGSATQRALLFNDQFVSGGMNPGDTVGENMGFFGNDPLANFNGWMNSPGHRRAMMIANISDWGRQLGAGDYHFAGVGLARGVNTLQISTARSESN